MTTLTPYEALVAPSFGAHRAPVNEALDRKRAEATGYIPRHCGCLACGFGFSHIVQVFVDPRRHRIEWQ